MPHDDVILSPRTSAWTVRASLADTLRDLPPADPTASVLVAPVADGPGGDVTARAALGALGLDAETLLATHEPASTAGTVTAVPLLPGAHAVRRVVLVGVDDGSDQAWRTAGAAVGERPAARARSCTRSAKARPRSRPTSSRSCSPPGRRRAGPGTARWPAASPQRRRS